VVYTGWTYEDGNTLVIARLRVSDGLQTQPGYSQDRCQCCTTWRGDCAPGTSGRTSQGPHLHFEVWKDGIPKDPHGLLLEPARIQ
jgi:hypothetical protein